MNFRKAILIALSVLFFARYGLYSLVPLLWSVFFNGIFLFRLSHLKKRGLPFGDGMRALTYFWVFVNLAMLAGFKYIDLPFPVAISFYTFTQIALLLDALHDKAVPESVSDYLLHILFFPKLLQGPIMTFAETKEGILDKLQENPTAEDVLEGLLRLTRGLVKKVLLADALSSCVTLGYNSVIDLTKPDAVIVMLVYPLQLYLDFSGYCDMGIGVSRMLGLRLPENFRQPYRASSVTEYWSRWHMSLTRFFRNYVYIPLGGNRKGKVRQIVNVLLVFLLSGLWHGGSLQTVPAFLVWGLWNAVAYIAERLLHVKPSKHPLRMALTYLHICVGLVFFRAGNVREALLMLTQPFRALPAFISPAMADSFTMEEIWYAVKMTPLQNARIAPYLCMIIVLAVTVYIVWLRGAFRKGVPAEDRDTAKVRPVKMLCYGALLMWCVISLSGVQTFLYVNF